MIPLGIRPFPQQHVKSNHSDSHRFTVHDCVTSCLFNGMPNRLWPKFRPMDATFKLVFNHNFTLNVTWTINDSWVFLGYCELNHQCFQAGKAPGSSIKQPRPCNPVRTFTVSQDIRINQHPIRLSKSSTIFLANEGDFTPVFYSIDESTWAVRLVGTEREVNATHIGRSGNPAKSPTTPPRARIPSLRVMPFLIKNRKPY